MQDDNQTILYLVQKFSWRIYDEKIKSRFTTGVVRLSVAMMKMKKVLNLHDGQSKLQNLLLVNYIRIKKKENFLPAIECFITTSLVKRNIFITLYIYDSVKKNTLFNLIKPLTPNTLNGRNVKSFKIWQRHKTVIK